MNSLSQISGRGYTISDENILMSLGVGSSMISALVIILYTTSDQVQGLYSEPLLLISLAVLFLYWISRLWIKANRGSINSDPVVFTLNDLESYITILFAFVIIVISKFYNL